MDVLAFARSRSARTSVTTALIALASAQAGCRAILGIDEDVPLLAADRDGPSASPDVPLERGGDGETRASGPGDAWRPPAAEPGPVVPADRRYALWPLAPSSPPLTQYDLTDDVVTDRMTGLSWTRKDVLPATFTYAAAEAHCAGLSLGGFGDWRIPTRIEQLSTFDFTIPFRLVSTEVFAFDVENLVMWWTSSERVSPTATWSRYTVDPFSGNVSVVLSPGSQQRARCVRGGPTEMAAEHWALGPGGETVIDRATKLEWQRTPSPARTSHLQAKAICESLELAGHDDYTLPTARELASLVDEARSAAPRVDALFAMSSHTRFWSATVRANPATAAWSVDFDSASLVNDELESGRLAVRCVRRLP